MSNISIRPATLADIPVIQQLAEGTWAPTYSSILAEEQVTYMFEKIYTTEALQEQIVEKKHTFLLLFLTDKPVGFASFGKIADSPILYKLHKIYLLPETQGQGAGIALLQAVEEAVKTLQAEALQLNVNRYNKALHFYQSQGYHIIREEDIPIGPYWMNDFVLEKKLI